MRNCLTCGEPLTRNMRKNGRWEHLRDFARRKFCNHACMENRSFGWGKKPTTSILNRKQRIRMAALLAWR